MMALETTEQRCLQQLARQMPYIRYLADRLRLRDWEFHAEIIEGDGSFDAEVECPHNRKVGLVRLTYAYFEQSPREQKHTLIHEFLHPHFLALQTHGNTLGDMLGKLFHSAFTQGLDDHLEKGIDAVADALTDILPDIDEWEAGKDCRVCAHGGLVAIREKVAEGKIEEALALLNSWPYPFRIGPDAMAHDTAVRMTVKGK